MSVCPFFRIFALTQVFLMRFSGQRDEVKRIIDDIFLNNPRTTHSVAELIYVFSLLFCSRGNLKVGLGPFFSCPREDILTGHYYHFVVLPSELIRCISDLLCYCLLAVG